MPDGRIGRLRVDSYGGLPVHEMSDFLSALRRAYEGVFVFETLMDDYIESARSLRRYEGRYDPLVPYWPTRYPSWLLELIASRQYGNELGTLLRDSDRLVVARVALSSPGFWEFLGALNPLELIRKYLQDRHVRRQDRAYREDAEQRRLNLENLQLENAVIRERLEMAREFGLPEAASAAFVNTVLGEPLRALEAVDNTGLIKSVEIVEERAE